MALNYQNIELTTDNQIALISLNHPKVNALSMLTLQELDAAIEAFSSDSFLRVAVITSAASLPFSAGADIKELKSLSKHDVHKFIHIAHHVYNKIESVPKIIIAAIQGSCLGGGNELAMSCDMLLASTNARFGQPEIKLGLIPGWGATQRLTRMIGKGRAMELMLTGDTIDAQEALRIGLINRVYPGDELHTQALILAANLAQKPRLALQYIKQAVKEGRCRSFYKGVEAEKSLFWKTATADDAQEGMDAFISGRAPSFNKH
jgi:enoyl-CoA hydratase/carnithine racemase